MPVVDVNALQYGLVGDGQSHPLSEAYSTLAEAAADYPLTTVRRGLALTDQIDWAAQQEAIYVARACLAEGQSAGVLGLGLGLAVVNRTLDLTSLVGARGLVIDASGTTIIPRLDDPAKPVVDMMGSRDLTIRDLNMLGTPQYPAAFGLQLGRRGEGGVVPGSPSNVFYNCKFNGHFTKGAVYNFASELCRWDHCLFANRAPDAHAYIGDGLYHWGVKSDFVDIVARRDVEQPFTVNTFSQCEWTCNAPQSAGKTTSPIWLASTKGHILDGYVSANTGGNRCSAVTLYSVKRGDENANLTLNVHDEGAEEPGLQHNIRFDGPNAHQVFFGLRKVDVSAAEFMFGRAPGVRTVTLLGADILVGNQGIRTRKAFDAPAFYRVAGNVALDQSNAPDFWNLPARLFQGSLTILKPDGTLETIAGSSSLPFVPL